MESHENTHIFKIKKQNSSNIFNIHIFTTFYNFQQSNKCKNLNMCEEIQLNRILTPILLHWTTAIGRSMTVFAHLMLLCD